MDLNRMPWAERRSRMKELGRRHPAFRALRRRVGGAGTMIKWLVIWLLWSFRYELGIWWAVGFTMASSIVDWWLERVFLMPSANYYHVLHE